MTPNRMSLLSVLPFTAILIIFTGLPLLMVVLLSFWTFDGLEYRPDFTLANFAAVFAAPVTWEIFGNTLRYAAITLVVGFTVSFYLVFNVRNLKLQIGLFCCVPSRSGPRA